MVTLSETALILSLAALLLGGGGTEAGVCTPAPLECELFCISCWVFWAVARLDLACESLRVGLESLRVRLHGLRIHPFVLVVYALGVLQKSEEILCRDFKDGFSFPGRLFELSFLPKS